MAGQADEHEEGGEVAQRSRSQIALDHLRAATGEVGTRGDGVSWAGSLDRLGERPPWAVAAAGIAALLVVVGGGLWWVAQQGAEPAGRSSPAIASSATIPMASPSTTVPPDLVVHVAGAVVHPGVYRSDPAARVGDLVATAGGFSPEADVDRLNLAGMVADGTRIYVPRVGETAPPTPSDQGGGTSGAAGDGGRPGGSSSSGQVDVNTASSETLEGLPGVGPATAAAIMEHRQRRGPFRSVDDLLDVPGIGPAKLEQMRSLVRV